MEPELCACGHPRAEHVDGSDVCKHHEGGEWCPCSKFNPPPAKRVKSEETMRELRRAAFARDY